MTVQIVKMKLIVLIVVLVKNVLIVSTILVHMDLNAVIQLQQNTVYLVLRLKEIMVGIVVAVNVL